MWYNIIRTQGSHRPGLEDGRAGIVAMIKDRSAHRSPLTDRFQRRIDYLRVSVTDQCNLRCVYCMPQSGIRHQRASDLLTDEEIVRVVSIVNAYGLRKVRITGGEPLLRKDILPLLSTLKKKLGVRDLSITTNGTALAESARALKQAGLDRVNISLDTLDPVRYRKIVRGGDLGLVWEAIEAAEAAGLRPVKINMVPMRGVNDDEIRAFAALTVNRDFHIRFIEQMPLGGDPCTQGDRILKDEIMARVAELGNLTRLPFRGKGPSRNYRIAGARGIVGFISPVSDHFCEWCNRLRLTATGLLRPCLFSNIEADLRTPLRNGASDAELRAIIEQAVQAKPERNRLHDPGSALPLVSLSQIGG